MKISTYTFPYVVPSPTIGLVYDLIELFPLFYLFTFSFLYLQHESKESKTQTNFIIKLAHNYEDCSLSRLSNKKGLN